MYDNMMNKQDYDVFISYRHSTGYYMAELLFVKLSNNGYSVFMDKTMHSGRFEEKIHNAMSCSRNCVFVLFPDDIKELGNENGWLNKEAQWALENENITIVPLMCDGFNWPQDDALATPMLTVKKNNGILVHKDYSLDRDLENLCDNFLKNVNPSKPRITATEFFKYNLEYRSDYKILGVDVAFHAGDPWLMPGEKHDLLMRSLKSNIPWRVLINTVDAAESIGQHMRDDTALYVSFSQVREQWKKLQEMYPDMLEVRECTIPLIHVYHSVKFFDEKNKHPYGESHIKYYAYNNTRRDNEFEHQFSNFSKYYSLYSAEFEFLWEKSVKI